MNINDYTSASCPDCGEKFTYNQFVYLMNPDYKVYCVCGVKHTLETINLPIRKTSEFLTTEEGAREHTWFHATIVENWYQKVTDGKVMVHIGELEASLDIQIVNNFEYNENPRNTFFLYEVRVKPETNILPTVGEDLDDLEDTSFINNQMKLYVNRWEAPGSISALIDPNMLEIVKVEELPINLVEGLDSLYYLECEALV